MSPELCLQQLPVMRRGRGEAEGVDIDSIIHGLETRKITEFHARFDFRKLYSLLNVYRCYSECTFLCIGGRRVWTKHPTTEVG